jgi:thymidylate kinase
MRELAQIEKTFLSLLFRKLHMKGIPFSLIRNYEGLPDKIGNDLDIYVPSANWNAARSILSESIHESSGLELKTYRLSYFSAHWIDLGAFQPLHIDLYPGAFTWKGWTYVSDGELLGNMRLVRGYPTFRKAYEALNLFATSLIWGGFFKPVYAEKIKKLTESVDNRIRFFELLKTRLGVTDEDAVASVLDCGISRSGGKKLALEMRSHVRGNALKSGFCSFVAGSIAYWRAELRSLVFPTGRLVALIGPDGAGKSTLIADLTPAFRPYFGDVHRYHWRPSFFPDFGELLQGRRKRTPGMPVKTPHGKPVHSAPLSLLRAMYYWLDFWVGYLFKIRRLLAKNHLVLFDRFAIDMWLDPKRFRLGLPDWLLWILVRSTPQPDLYLFLSAPAVTLHHRKPETSSDTVQAMLDRQEASANSQSKRSVVIDVSLSPSDSLKAACMAIKRVLGPRQ